MIDTVSRPTQSDVEQNVSIIKGEEVPRGQATSWDYFVGTIVVILGIVLGAIAALFIGLYTNWIEITC